LGLRIQPRDRTAWSLDALGLLIQGMGVPVLQTLLIAKLMGWVLPTYRGVLDIPPAWGFALSFIGVDYLYYWNHRFLHSRGLWPLHQVHHSIKGLDVLATSRNSAWTVFFIVYLWVQPLFVFLLKDPSSFMAGLIAGYTLDVWRHSGWSWNRQNPVVRALRQILIDPQDHEWHHSQERFHINYGANLNLWDRLHGTFYRSERRPQKVGVVLQGSFWKQFLTPWRLR
jgi:sterol desaturase/sphingolipid hydroxylase (fatty acid hydroxylase superfamily)